MSRDLTEKEKLTLKAIIILRDEMSDLWKALNHFASLYEKGISVNLEINETEVTLTNRSGVINVDQLKSIHCFSEKILRELYLGRHEEKELEFYDLIGKIKQ